MHRHQTKQDVSASVTAQYTATSANGDAQRNRKRDRETQTERDETRREGETVRRCIYIAADRWMGRCCPKRGVHKTVQFVINAHAERNANTVVQAVSP